MYAIGQTVANGHLNPIDRRALMFPVCSGSLDLVGVILQIVAVATSYWAHFKRERYTDAEIFNIVEPITAIKSDPLYEEGHYGLWQVCLTGFGGQKLSVEDCSSNFVHFHPSSWRVFTGIIATINIVLSLIFMATIPFQFRHLKSGRPVYCKYKTLTRIKLVLSIVGALCGIMAAVLFGIHSHHKYYKEPKGWSFGLQIIVIIVEVFLIICSSAENVSAARIDEARPKTQFLFTISGNSFRKPSAPDSHISQLSSVNTIKSTGVTPTKKKKRKVESSDRPNEVVTEQDLSKDNPIFVDSDNEDSIDNHLNEQKQTPIVNSRFVVVKVADMFTNSSPIDGAVRNEAYDNLAYVVSESENIDSIKSLDGPSTSVKVTDM